MKDQPLSIEIKNGRLEMSIGVDCLLAAIEYGLEMRAEEFEVTDKSKWLGEIVNALHIEEEEKELGFKHVFQTKVTNKTTGTRIRSPLKLFSKDQTFIDNDAQQLLDILAEYYDIPIKK